MNRIDAAFARLKKENGKALIPFVTAGDPDLGATHDILLALEDAGADVIELGVPFSDPMADGPTIQLSYQRALKAGTTLEKVLGLVSKVRARSQVPILLFGYYNPFMQFGTERLASSASEVGVDGILCVDLPPEESDELRPYLDAQGLHQIFLLAPTSDEARMEAVLKCAGGFIYFVSVTGVTGARTQVHSRVQDKVRWIKSRTPLPVCVGFGVSAPEHVREICTYADGVVVGSALINVINASKTPAKAAGDFLRQLKAATRG